MFAVFLVEEKMRNGVIRVIAVSAVVAACAAFAPVPASARVVVGFGFGVPLVAPAPVYYPPPPVYYPPPAPVYYVPPPAGTPVPAPTPDTTSGQCREYSSTTVIAGTPQQVYGTACLQPDGTWRIVH
jgi:hypothetical protein